MIGKKKPLASGGKAPPLETNLPQPTSSPPKTAKQNENEDDLNEMYHYQNGNLPYSYGYYPNPNRYLSYSSATGHSSAASDELAAGPSTSSSTLIFQPSLSKNQQAVNQVHNKNYSAKDGNDLNNIPHSVVIQLENCNRTIAAQNIEIERLRSYQNQNGEAQLLKKQISGLEKEMRSSRERFLEQQELLAEMSREMENLLREKLQMQTSLRETEKKYKKAKTATRELAKILENDMCAMPKSTLCGFESDDEDGEYRNSTSQESLLRRSRALSRSQESNQMKAKAEKVLEKAEERKRKEAVKADDESRELMERVLLDNENLLFELDKERRISQSLQDDLEKNRRMVLDRDEELDKMKKKLGAAEEKAKQCENDLSRTSTDLALERARCDALTLELHELDIIFSQNQSTVQALAMQNEELDERCRSANQTIVSLNAKLEAQGIDLVTTKKTLRAFRESSQKRSGPL